MTRIHTQFFRAVPHEKHVISAFYLNRAICTRVSTLQVGRFTQANAIDAKLTNLAIDKTLDAPSEAVMIPSDTDVQRQNRRELLMRGDRPYILVVDDEFALRMMLARWLERWGYEVITVGNAQDACAIMRQRPASVVVSDLIMPGDTGLWLLGQIRSEWPQTPVIVESGALSEETILKARELGAVDFIPKPFAREQLRQALLKAFRDVPQSTGEVVVQSLNRRASDIDRLELSKHRILVDDEV